MTKTEYWLINTDDTLHDTRGPFKTKRRAIRCREILKDEASYILVKTIGVKT